MIEVLLLHRRKHAEGIWIGIAAAVKAGSTSPDVVAIEARKAAARDPEPEDDEDDPSPWADLPGVQPVSLTAYRIAPPDDRRPTPLVDHYDQLLTHRPKGFATRPPFC